jgi:indole-3-glycerol phosphate synthase
MEQNILQKIIESKHNELTSLKSKYPHISKRKVVKSSFRDKFSDSPHVKVIAEIKPSSPSEGKIIEPTKEKIQNIASIYSQYPIGAISVLTDSTYFNGAYINIGYVKEVTDKPVLCKEFIIDEFQIDLACHFDADAILLIAEALPLSRCLELYHYAKSKGLAVLFEFHDEKNLSFLIENKIEIIGINNRDLNRMTTDIQKCITLKESIPDEQILIAESGFYTKNEIMLLEEKQFNGVLIGTSLLKSNDMEKKLKEIVYYYE